MLIRTAATSAADVLDQPVVRALLESTSEGVVAIDAESRQVLFMNPTARRALGYSEDEVIGCQCKRLMNSPACSLSCPLTALLEGRVEGAELELYYRGREGDEMLHAATRMLVVTGADGRPLVGLELFTDLREVKRLRRALLSRTSLEGIIGRSGVMQALYDLVEQVAPYDVPVLITGESGVGKERFADAIQRRSGRVTKPFVKVNCAALTPTLVESELFGHVRGAFTGAARDRKGRFEEAHGGTLLLDEVGELPVALQAKLLRVLQEGELRRVGDERVRAVDVRVIAATNRRIESDVAEGRFRQDLYYRLAGLHLDVPALRAAFVDRFATEQGIDAPTISHAAMVALVDRDWPGNVRELENVIRLACIRGRAKKRIAPADLSPSAELSEGQQDTLMLKELEERAIEAAMKRTDGNVSRAAKLLGIDRTTLWRKLKRE